MSDTNKQELGDSLGNCSTTPAGPESGTWAAEGWPVLTPILFCVAIGIVNLCANSLMAWTILSRRELRKDHLLLLLSGLGVADAFYACSGASTSLRQVRLLFGRGFWSAETPWGCLFLLDNHVMLIGSQASALANIALSLDRVVAIRYYVRYLTITSKQIAVLLGVIFGYSVAVDVGVSVWSYHTPDRYVPAICWINEVAGTSFRNYIAFFQMSCTVASTALYLYAALQTSKHMRVVKIAFGIGTAAKQTRLVRSVGLSVTATFVLFLIPNSILTYIYQFAPEVVGPWAYWVWGLMGLNYTLNIFIYGLGHPDVRHEVKKMRDRLRGNTAKVQDIPSALPPMYIKESKV